jgi:hypothetical protein
VPETTNRRWNTDPIWGLLLAVGALIAGAAFFLNPPMQRPLPWLSLALAIVALFFLARGLRRTFAGSQIYRGKALSIVLIGLALLPAGGSIFAFFGARALPGTAGSPQVGQKVPDFTLSDTSGQPASLDSLFASSGETQAAPPKAVLLIFYRGYW